MANKRWLVPLGVVAIFALTLVWWRPWTGATTSPTPPPPAATRTPERIALPTERPRPSAPPSNAATATPVVASPTLRAAIPAASVATSGTLFYLGTVAGRSGIVASNADGSVTRLVAPGLFNTLAVSPDGTRIAVVGPIVDGGGAYQLAIFDADGRALVRQEFGRGNYSALLWSPGSRYLVTGMPARDPFPRWDLRVFSDQGSWLINPPTPSLGFPYKWLSDERIAYLASTETNQARQTTLWTTDVTGGDAQVLYDGPYLPIAWNTARTLFYALDSDQATNPTNQNNPLNPTRLIAVDIVTGTVRLLADANNLADVFDPQNDPRGYRFDFADLSTDGMTFAIGLSRIGTIGTPGRLRATTVFFVKIDGEGTSVTTISPNAAIGPGIWSPDGSRYASLAAGEREGDGLLSLFDVAGNRLAEYPVARAFAGNYPQIIWSPDGRWLAFTSAADLSIAAPGTVREPRIIPGGSQPAWRR